MSEGRGVGSTIGMAFALFVMLNGVVLMVLGAPEGSDAADASCDCAEMAGRIEAASGQVMEARQALDAMNYSETRAKLDQAEQQLGVLGTGL